jgi:acyl carrier protein
MKTVKTVKEIVLEIYETQAGESVAVDTRFDGLSCPWDSLDAVEAVMELEHAFAIDIDDDEAEKLNTVSDALVLVCRRLGAHPNDGWDGKDVIRS